MSLAAFKKKPKKTKEKKKSNDWRHSEQLFFFSFLFLAGVPQCLLKGSESSSHILKQACWLPPGSMNSASCSVVLWDAPLLSAIWKLCSKRLKKKIQWNKTARNVNKTITLSTNCTAHRAMRSSPAITEASGQAQWSSECHRDTGRLLVQQLGLTKDCKNGTYCPPAWHSALWSPDQAPLLPTAPLWGG